MTSESNGQLLCRLLAAWIHETDFEPEDLLDFEALFQMADRHLLSAATHAALEQTGLIAECPPETAERFRQAKAQSIRRTLLMDAERASILAALEENGIWFAPLKGVIINKLYPEYGTRQFADNDIYYNSDRWRDVRDIMKEHGFKVELTMHVVHDIYQKPPIYNFEMHRSLFAADDSPVLQNCDVYYENGRERLIKDDDNSFGYHFSDEDFYIYFIAHAFKHFVDYGGTGLRTLLDVYLYREAHSEMDVDYINGELQNLGLTEFEAAFCSLADKLFAAASSRALTDEEQTMLDWIESSGVYGTVAHRVQSGLRKIQPDGEPVTAKARVRYLFRRIFPDMRWYQTNAPFVVRHRWAIPLYWLRRLARGIFKKGRQSLQEAKEALTRNP